MAERPLPTSSDPRAAVVLALLAFVSSLRTRGGWRSVRLLTIALGLASGAEVLAIRGTRTLRHHSRPQRAELPLAIPLLWYAYAVVSYGLAQAAAGDRQTRTVSLLTALLATATDVANDPWGLASGLWEWRDGGSYLPDVVGATGRTGIPLGNYAGWLLIMAGVAWLAEQGHAGDEAANARAQRTPLLLAYWVLGSRGLIWAARERRWTLVGTASLLVLGGGSAAWYAAGRTRSRSSPNLASTARTARALPA